MEVVQANKRILVAEGMTHWNTDRIECLIVKQKGDLPWGVPGWADRGRPPGQSVRHAGEADLHRPCVPLDSRAALVYVVVAGAE